MLCHIVVAAFILTSQPETPPLSGPDVPESRLRSLVQQGMTRGFVRIEGRPEIAAAGLLELDEETLQSVRQAEQAREAAIVFMLVDHLDELRAMTDANIAGDTDTAQRLMREWWTGFDEGGNALPLLDELRNVLLPEQLSEVARYSEEYLAAWVAEEKLQGETSEQTRQRLALQMFREEIARAYEASLRQTQQALQGIYDAVDPTPEQRQDIRTVVIEHVKRTRLNAEPSDRRLAMRRIYDLLDEERKGRLFDYAMRIVVPNE